MSGLPCISPAEVAGFISFERKNLDWTYEATSRTIPNLQAEGVAAIWNLLATRSLAILADEVGMGKTIQAMGAISLLWRLQNNARVLVVAPNQTVAENWATEFTCFLQDHYKHADNVVKCEIGGAAIHPPRVCGTLAEVVEAFEVGLHRFVITKISIFSHLGDRGEDGGLAKKAKQAADRAAELRTRLMDALGKPIDLLVIDEAHYLRNVDGKSQRVSGARAFFGSQMHPTAQRVLLMTATPNHTTNSDVGNLIGYFRDKRPSSADEVLGEFAVRRLRVLGTKIKYQYREEEDLECSFGQDQRAEIFFALYQKKLADLEERDVDPQGNDVPLFRNERKSFLYGYLEGFETVQGTPPEEAAAGDDAQERSDYRSSIDTKYLRELAHGYRERFGENPRHPKYDLTTESMVPTPGEFWSRHERLPEEDKHLVFVRRIPSSRELAARMNEGYDRLLLGRILDALEVDPKRVDEMLARRSLRRNLHQAVRERLASRSEEMTVAEDGVDEEAGARGGFLPSQVMDYFRKDEGGDIPYTHGVVFRARFQQARELFPLFFQPPPSRGCLSLPRPSTQADYRRWAQSFRMRAMEEDQARLLAAHWKFPPIGKRSTANFAVQDHSGDPRLETLASIYGRHLGAGGRGSWEEILGASPCLQEAFFETFLRKGLLLASGAVAELYGWYLRALQAPRGDGRLYEEFCRQVDRGFPGSLTQALVAQALESFRDIAEKIHGLYGDQAILRHSWNELNAHDPAAFCTGEVTDRQRLIRSFNTPFFPNVIVATSVLQEGVNLHLHCRRVLHYGIAWTPGDNEQRVGRVDRLFGAVHRNIARSVDDRLLIRYPYLAGSFDEDQVGQFLERKHSAERVLDRGQTISTNRAIDVARAGAPWKSWLRKPESHAGAERVADPYPFRLEDVGPGGDSRWTPPSRRKSQGTTLVDRFSMLLREAGDVLAIAGECSLLRSEDPYRWYFEPRLEGVSGRRHQPVEARLVRDSGLAAFSDRPVFSLQMTSPLFRERPKGLEDVVGRWSRSFPLVQLCEAQEESGSHFHYHARACLPIFATGDAIDDCSPQEVGECLRQLILGAESLEQSLRPDQDLPLDDAFAVQSTSLLRAASVARRGEGGLVWDGRSPSLGGCWKVKDGVARLPLEAREGGVQELLRLQFRHSFLFGNNLQAGRIDWELRFPSFDFDESEQHLLERWGRYLAKVLRAEVATTRPDGEV